MLRKFYPNFILRDPNGTAPNKRFGTSEFTLSSALTAPITNSPLPLEGCPMPSVFISIFYPTPKRLPPPRKIKRLTKIQAHGPYHLYLLLTRPTFLHPMQHSLLYTCIIVTMVLSNSFSVMCLILGSYFAAEVSMISRPRMRSIFPAPSDGSYEPF